MQQSIIKITVVGKNGVGKSSITIRMVNGIFVDEYDPTIEDTYRIVIQMNRQEIVFVITDSSNLEEESSIFRELIFTKADGFIFVYSICNHESFNYLETIRERIYWLKDMDVNQFFPIVIAGNKIDLENERQVTIEEGQQLADKWDVDFIECSAKEAININELFQGIAQLILEDKQLQNETQNKQRHKTNFGCVLC
ncbi:ras-related protein Rap-1b [Entamoeba marina]